MSLIYVERKTYILEIAPSEIYYIFVVIINQFIHLLSFYN